MTSPPSIRSAGVRRRLGRTAVVAAAALALAPLAAPPAGAAAGVFVVTSTGDAGDRSINGTCATSDGSCTLRAALQEANAYPGAARITFALPGSGPFTIWPATRLPELRNPSGTTLDGYTQSGSAVNTAAHGSNATIMVQVRGRGEAAFHGLVVTSAHNTIRGLALFDFRVAVLGSGDNASYNSVLGSFVCTDAAGRFRAPTVNGGAGGVLLGKGADHNRVGSPALADRNVVAGCAHRGITMSYAGASFNVVQNNVVGLAPNGTALPNRAHGIDVNYSAQDNLIGGTGAREGNVSSGNVGSGVEVSHGNGNRRNRVIGNFLGTDVTGTTASSSTANGEYGVHLEGDYPCDGCAPNAGYGEVAHNVVVNNALGGILISKGQQHNSVHDNRVGVLPSGAAAGNAVFGVRIEHGSVNNTVGPGNVIAHNARGVVLEATRTTPRSSSLLAVRGNRLTQNRTYGNGGLGIDLAPLGRVNIGGVGMPEVQDAVQAPRITSATTTRIYGTTCGGCVVEAFLADTSSTSSGSPADYGEGKTYLATAKASSSGAFAVDISARALAPGRVVTVNTTDPARNTSEFGRNVALS